MRPVNVNKDGLIDTLTTNRNAHRAIFEEALEGYRRKALELFEAQVELIRTGGKFRPYVSLSEPSDHTADYDTVLGMLALSVDDTVELDEQSYRSFILDEWSWKQQFLISNSAYSSTAARLAVDGDD